MGYFNDDSAFQALAVPEVALFHAAQLTATMDALNRERWVRVDVPVEYQWMLDSHYDHLVAHIDQLGEAGDEQEKARVFLVQVCGEIERFPVVEAVLTLLHTVSLHVSLAGQLPAEVRPQVGMSLWIIMAQWRRRVRKLILAAGALHTTGLRTITAGHVALCMQSVGLISTQLPVIARLLPGGDASSVEALVGEYGQLQREVLLKLNSIMCDIADAAFKELIPALLAPPVRGQEVDPVLRTLMQQTRILNVSLTPVLSGEQRRRMFERLCREYCAMFARGWRAIGKEDGRERAVAAVSWMIEQFYQLPGQDLLAIEDIAQLLHIAM